MLPLERRVAHEAAELLEERGRRARRAGRPRRGPRLERARARKRGGEPRERLLARAADAREERVAALGRERAAEAEEVLQRAVEEDELGVRARGGAPAGAAITALGGEERLDARADLGQPAARGLVRGRPQPARLARCLVHGRVAEEGRVHGRRRGGGGRAGRAKVCREELAHLRVDPRALVVADEAVGEDTARLVRPERGELALVAVFRKAARGGEGHALRDGGELAQREGVVEARGRGEEAARGALRERERRRHRGADGGGGEAAREGERGKVAAEERGEDGGCVGGRGRGDGEDREVALEAAREVGAPRAGRGHRRDDRDVHDLRGGKLREERENFDIHGVEMVNT